MTHEQIERVVGPYDLLSEEQDDDGREVVCIEYADARQGYLREELDGKIAGPVLERWMLDDDCGIPARWVAP